MNKQQYQKSPCKALFIDSTILYPKISRGDTSISNKYTRSKTSYLFPSSLNYNQEFHLPRRKSNYVDAKELHSPLVKQFSSISSKSESILKTKAKAYERNSTVLPRWWRAKSENCTPDQLHDIIKEPIGYYALPTDPYNEVYPGIYLSDGPTAMCTTLLKKLGITHVLNAAQGKERHAGQVNTWPGFYSYSGIKFLGVEAFDNIVFKLHVHFEDAAHFIDEALKDGGKVLVHCRAGISRSATLVCAFLMLKRDMSAQEAVKSVRKHRAIIPNDGFLQQLCDLNDKLINKKKMTTGT